MIHYLHREQNIPGTLNEVWDFFGEPLNLNTITPGDMNFEIVAGGDAKMYEGQMIEYRVEFIRGVRSLWLTEITHVRDREYFVDEQRIGPYRLWHHEHIFAAMAGGVKMTDKISYVPPYGFLGDLVHDLWVGRRLRQIFDFRQKRITELFGSME
ncbi:MAG: cell division inhibitor [Chloroflexi bacterium]|nr:MAG: cell division inhibitor [Chloroflexota bacterium]